MISFDSIKEKIFFVGFFLYCNSNNDNVILLLYKNNSKKKISIK